MDIETIHQFLTNSYWAKGRSRDLVARSIDGSFCVGLFLDKYQVGFARAVTDKVLFGYIFDVFILKEYRGRGWSRILLKTLLEHPDLKGIKWMLKTTDAGGLYEKFGFKPSKSSDGVYIRINSAEP